MWPTAEYHEYMRKNVDINKERCSFLIALMVQLPTLRRWMPHITREDEDFEECGFHYE